ncbi:MAG: UDP-4-amino-4,6-dideoxy-N-acetyl-beta-L-altrosamine N-acetyltransferase [Aquificaceae bacterium]
MIELLKSDLPLKNVFLKNFLNLGDVEISMVRLWRNSENVRRWSYSDHEITPLEHLEFLNALKSDRKNFYYLVYESQSPLGVISLNRLDLRHKNSFCGLYKNPEKLSVGKRLLEALLELAFDVLSLHTLKLEVIEGNVRAIELYKSFGFKEEGRLKEFVFKDGRWLDVILMGILNS